MRAYVELTRPGNAGITAGAVLLGLYAAAGPDALADVPKAAALAATGLLFAAGANALNDATDAAIDRAAHPSRPIPSGRASAERARRLAAALLVLSFVPTAAVAPQALWVVAAALALEVAYEFRLKALGAAGNLCVATLASAPFVLAAEAAGGATGPVLAFGGLAALATLGRELLKDLEDAPHDAGRSTLARTRPRAALGVAAGALVAAVALSPVPALLPETVLGTAYLAAVVPADAAFLAAAASAREPARAQRTAKLAMVLALAALAAGRFLEDLA